MQFSQSSYYVIDAILAEEELVPCTTQFGFQHLAHLDPDVHDNKDVLPAGSRIKLPIWALHKWANLDFVSLSLPRHFQRKARDRLEAAPSEVNLRKRNERFFLAGRFMVDLVHTSAREVRRGTRSSSSRRERLEQNLQEAKRLQMTLLKTYTGERLRQTLDWSLSSVGDDVSSYTRQLTEMERRLFQCGAVAATAHLRWRVFGKRQWLLRTPPAVHHGSSTGNGKRSAARPVSPEGETPTATTTTTTTTTTTGTNKRRKQ